MIFSKRSVAFLISAAGVLASSVTGQVRSDAVVQERADARIRYDGHQVIRVTVTTQQELLAVSRIATDIWNCRIGIGPLDVQVTPAQRAAIESMGLITELVVPDVQVLIDREAAAIAQARLARDNAWFTTYKTLAEFNAFIDQLVADNPSLASSFTIGDSIQSRPIRGLRFSAPDMPGNPRSSRPAVFFQGGQHAREWINPAVTIYIAHNMLERYPTDSRIRGLMERAEIIVLPILNPDGYEFSWTTTRLWRKNRRLVTGTTYGVDLNRNWDYQWGGQGSSGTPSDETYRGTAGFSEPETAAMRDFVIANPRIRTHIDFHSYGQLILSPFGYTAMLPPDGGLFDAINGEMSVRIQSVHNRYYRPGPTYTNIYPAAGVVQDWLYGARGILSWGIELRAGPSNGFILPQEEIIPNCEEAFEGAIRLVEWTVQPLWVSLANPLPLWASTTSGTPIEVRVRDNVEPQDAAAVRVFSRVAGFGSFTPTTISASGQGVYPHVLPPPPCGNLTEFYIEAASTAGSLVRFPSSGVLSIRSAETVVPVNFDGESNAGFVIGQPGDTATAGVWQRGISVGTNYQPAGGATGSTSSSWATGLAGGGSNANDVDGGSTSLLSGVFSALPPEGMKTISGVLRYARRFGTTGTALTGLDTYVISISNDGGSTWQQIEMFQTNNPSWSFRSLELAQIIRPTTQMRMRFVATDVGVDSVTEAGVDDITLTLRYCRRSADVDDGSGTGVPDGGVTIEDLLYFLGMFDRGEIEADYTNDDGVTIEDLLLYLQTFDDGY